MKTKYKINKDELVLDINFLYDMGFNQNNDSDIYNYVNKIISNNKIKFKGSRVLVYINGIFIGTLYTISTYLKKIHLKKIHLKNNYILNEYNSYFERYNIIEIIPN